MKCPVCGFPDSKVIDSRPTESGSIRRRRECLSCQKRFTTYETYELSDSAPLIVRKKDGSRQVFDRSKVLTGVLSATYKRHIPPERIDRLVQEVEGELVNSLRTEFTSEEIGLLVMEKLRELDEVSYVRFASVYREFRDVDTFLAEIDHLRREGAEES